MSSFTNSAQRGARYRVRRSTILIARYEGPPAPAGRLFRLSRIPVKENKSDQPPAELQRIRLRRSPGSLRRSSTGSTPRPMPILCCLKLVESTSQLSNTNPVRHRVRGARPCA